jgi:hypothetical protein
MQRSDGILNNLNIRLRECEINVVVSGFDEKIVSTRLFINCP